MIAFDFDGTLIDSMGMWRNLSRNYLKKKGIPFYEELAQKLTTMSLSMCATYFSEELGIPMTPEEILGEMGAEILRQYTEVLALKPGAKELLDLLKRRDYDMCLATATNEKFVIPALDHFGLRDYFSFIQTCDNSGFRKNHRGFYEVLSKRSNVPPEEVLLVDDAAYALDAASQAGMKTLAFYDENSKEAWEKGLYRGHPGVRTLQEVEKKVGELL